MVSKPIKPFLNDLYHFIALHSQQIYKHTEFMYPDLDFVERICEFKLFENVEYIVANTNSGLKNNQLSVSEIESVKVEFINIVAQNSYIEYKDGEGKFIKARVELEGTTFELIYNYYIR